jgi:hypothetical protein
MSWVSDMAVSRFSSAIACSDADIFSGRITGLVESGWAWGEKDDGALTMGCFV